MLKGKVQFINHERAFGFIQCPDYAKGIFFHIRDFKGAFDELKKGDEVTFETAETPKGIAGKEVKLYN